MRPIIVVLPLLAGYVVYWFVRAQAWRLGVVFNVGMVLVLSGGIPGVMFSYNHDPSMKWFTTASFVAGSALMVFGAWPILKRPETRRKLLPGIAVLFGSVFFSCKAFSCRKNIKNGSLRAPGSSSSHS